MDTYTVRVKFIDGQKIEVEVEADSDHEALNNAMPIELLIIDKQSE